jgi:hypothetical protein
MFFVLDENHNLIEAFDKEGVLSVLEQAIKDGSLSGIVADSAFVTKLKCCVSGQTNRIAFVTQAKYNELEAKGQTENGVYYYITDDDTLDGIDNRFKELDEKCLYQHKIDVSFSATQGQNAGLTKAIIVIYNNTPDVFTKRTLSTYLSQFGEKGYPVNGFTTDGANSSAKVYPLIKAYSYENSIELFFVYTDCVTAGDLSVQSSGKNLGHQVLSTEAEFNVIVDDIVTKLL